MVDIKKLVVVELDKPRHLRLTLTGLLEFEKITGKNLLKGLDFKTFKMAETAALIYCCLIHEDENLTLRDVTNMIDLDNMSEVMSKVYECMAQSLPEVEKSSRPLVKKRRAG